MKKIKFIVPAIFGLAIITGIAAILLAAISKILIIAGFAGLAISVGVRRFARRKQMQQQYGMYGAQNFDQVNGAPAAFHGNMPYYHSNVVPVSNRQRTSGIIPIN